MFSCASSDYIHKLRKTEPCVGVQATQHARETLEAVAAQGKLGAAGRGGRVIYAQTDSIFASFPNATTEQAIQVLPQPFACMALLALNCVYVRHAGQVVVHLALPS